MTQYLVLLYENQAGWEAGGADAEQGLKDHGAFQAKHGDVLRGGGWLQPTATAVSVRRDVAGGFTDTDGPFVETKEALGGYYLIEAPDLATATAIAHDVPAPFGGVEVRALREMN